MYVSHVCCLHTIHLDPLKAFFKSKSEARHLKYDITSTSHHAIGSWHHAIGSWHHAIGSWHHAIGSWHHVIGSWHHVTGCTGSE